MSSDSKHASTKNEDISNGTKTEEVGGIDHFPERRGDKIQRNWFRRLFLGENRDNLQHVRCERQVVNLVKESPLIKLLLDAFKSAGCEIDLNRHIACEPCSLVVTGGYDSELNQIVVCQNTATSKGKVHGALAHEMIHMFDFCRAQLDFKNPEHLLCTEIRAANLIHCSFLSAAFMGAASLIRIKRQHRECVRMKAIASVMAVRDMTVEEANALSDQIFDRCYNDMEPLGRHIKRNSTDIDKIYRERYIYGYGEVS